MITALKFCHIAHEQSLDTISYSKPVQSTYPEAAGNVTT
jgi:hypothetical protein